MSGSAGIRGYLLQTIITLIDALKSNGDWTSLGLEPNNTSEKVDIIWYYPLEHVKVTQVKSSQNQISLEQVKGWATELENSYPATDYELVLLGPCSQSVITLGKFGKVVIPPPKNIDPIGLMEQAAHRLDIYIEKRKNKKVSAFTRELLVNALVTRLETYSTSGTIIPREDFFGIVDDWLLSTLDHVQKTVQSKSMQQNSMTYGEWVDTFIKFQTRNNLLDSAKVDFINWMNQVQAAIKIISSGIHLIAQGGSITKPEIWNIYSDAKQLEETLEKTDVPVFSLEAHFAIRESARYYRRAVGNLYDFNQTAFSEELGLAIEKAKLAKMLLNKLEKVNKL